MLLWPRLGGKEAGGHPLCQRSWRSISNSSKTGKKERSGERTWQFFHGRASSRDGKQNKRPSHPTSQARADAPPHAHKCAWGGRGICAADGWAKTEATRARSQRRFVCCYVHGCLSSHAEWTLRQQGNIVPVRSAGPLNPLLLACTAASRCQDPQGRWQRPTRPLRFASGSRWCFCAGNGTACVRQPQLAEASTRAQGQTRVCVPRGGAVAACSVCCL